MICKHILLIAFLNEPKLILLHTIIFAQSAGAVEYTDCTSAEG